jgi:hypothetical protein
MHRHYDEQSELLVQTPQVQEIGKMRCKVIPAQQHRQRGPSSSHCISIMAQMLNQ